MQGTTPTYSSLTDSGRLCADVFDWLTQHTGRPFRFDPWNGSTFLQRADGSAVFVNRDDERRDVWNVQVVDDIGQPLTVEPAAVVVSADADPDAIAQAIAPHVLALAPIGPTWNEVTADENYEDDSATGRVWKREYPTGRTGVVIPYASGRFVWELWTRTTFEAVGLCDTDAQAREACDTCEHNTAAQ